MATVKEINHDSSTTLSDFYTTTVSDPDGAASITPAAALNGTVNGVNIDYDAGTDFVTLQEDFATLVGNEFRWRFRLDFSNTTFSGGSISFILQFFLRSGSSSIFRIAMSYAGGSGELQMTPAWYNDSGIVQTFGTVSFPESGDTCVELRAIRETGATAADGEVELFINGVSQLSVSNAENFARFGLGIDRARLQWSSFDPDITGDLYYDEWILDDVATADLGCGAGVLTLSNIPKPASVDASGEFIYLALLNNGTPILSKFSTALDADGTTVFDPGAGDAIGVECARFNADVIWIAGNFDGTNVVEKSEDAGVSFVVKDNAAIGDIRAFAMGPDSDDKLLVFDETNGDILETRDDGAIWTTINAAVTPEVNAIARLGENVQESVFGNDGGANNSINYSINSGDDLEDFQTGVYPNANATGVIVN